PAPARGAGRGAAADPRRARAGLWVGVDIAPSCTSARDLVERLAAAGVLSKETHETVIRFAPPLTITYELIDRAVDIFHRVARERHAQLGLDSKGGLPRTAAAAT